MIEMERRRGKVDELSVMEDGKEMFINNNVPAERVERYLERTGLGKGAYCMSTRMTMTVLCLMIFSIFVILCLTFMMLFIFLVVDLTFDGRMAEWFNMSWG